MRDSASSYEDYLRDLRQELVISPLDAYSLPRVAQLHERTNQFNLTTRRFTASDLAAFMADRDHALVLSGTANDRFGNHGIVIAAVVVVEGATARIESLLMSCRVIAREIETAFLGALIDRLTQRGIATVMGRYSPTPKNGIVRSFYADRGFVAAGPSPGPSPGESEEWIWRAGKQAVPASSFVEVKWSVR